MELIDGMIADDGTVFEPTAIVVPYRFYPFPYSTYFIDGSEYPNPFPTSYYDDASLDGVKLKITLGGDNAAWSDSGSYYNFGLLTPAQSIDPLASYYASGGTYGYGYYPGTIDTWHFLGAFKVDSPIQKLRYSVAGQNDPGPGAQVIYLPGVASITGYDYSYYNAVILKGNPVWFELEFQQNEFKTNPNVYYSGYTNLGDFNSYEFGSLYSAQPGYMRRLVGGLVKKDVNLATCTVNDIILGAIWTAEDLGGGVFNGVGHVVLNGVIRGTCTTTSKPEKVEMSIDPITQQPFTELGNNAQYWDNLYLWVGDGSSSTLAYVLSDSMTYPAGIASDAVDVYDVKYVWYVDYVPDAGPGTAAGEWGFYMPAMYTHPGWNY